MPNEIIKGGIRDQRGNIHVFRDYVDSVDGLINQVPQYVYVPGVTVTYIMYGPYDRHLRLQHAGILGMVDTFPPYTMPAIQETLRIVLALD